MRIAVTYDNGEVFQHFGHTEQFKVYEVEGGGVQDSFLLDASSGGHCALGGFLKQNGVDALICGGIGPGAIRALADAGITLYGGVTGSADEAIAAYLADSLDFNPDEVCNAHGSEGFSCHH